MLRACRGYFLNFTGYGLQINNGHEVMMDRCWLGETNFDYDFEKEGTQPTATAIQINGNAEHGNAVVRGLRAAHSVQVV